MREHKKSHLGIMGWAMFLAGALSLGSCSSDETLETMEKKAIAFGNVSIENGSRAAEDPSYNGTKLLGQFNVWGTVKGNVNTVQIFDGATVTRGEAAYSSPWECSVTQYWIPNAIYNFMAIANADPANVTKNVTTGMPETITYNVDATAIPVLDGSKDLLLGEPVVVQTDEMAEPYENHVNENGCVAFIMSHLLSKVHFSFLSTSSLKSIQISDIQVKGYYASGIYTIGADEPWDVQEEPTDENAFLNFGSASNVNSTTAVESTYARLIIPGNQTWTISFLQDGEQKSTTLTHTFNPNTEYNIRITVEGGSEITFVIDIEVFEKWGNKQDIPLNP